MCPEGGGHLNGFSFDYFLFFQMTDGNLKDVEITFSEPDFNHLSVSPPSSSLFFLSLSLSVTCSCLSFSLSLSHSIFPAYFYFPSANSIRIFLPFDPVLDSFHFPKSSYHSDLFIVLNKSLVHNSLSHPIVTHSIQFQAGE